MNPDLEKERKGATINVAEMKRFLGEKIFGSHDEYLDYLKCRTLLMDEYAIKPISDFNYFNLDRDEKFQLVFQKGFEMKKALTDHDLIKASNLLSDSVVLGVEKYIYGLDSIMFKVSINIWATDEQREYWNDFFQKNSVFGTYIQTELGHGTFVRGLETTATYDKKTQEFIIDSPTLTSIKYWPGSSAKTSNFALLMAKLFIDGKDHGIHAFVVQLRSLYDHKVLPGIELYDIGSKFGFEPLDNGCIKFNKFRVPLQAMLMKYARVSPCGKFERTGSELLMYAAMLLLRADLSLVAFFHLSRSTTIAVRYSCVRRQTPMSNDGTEPQVMDYQTQQYRLMPAIAATYAVAFSAHLLVKTMREAKEKSRNFERINSAELAKLHANASGLKSFAFSECLKYAQSNRLCCGGHGYSASSGLGALLAEADAGCTYEGDNVVLLLQTARYIIKCVQKGISPHLEPDNMALIKSSAIYAKFKPYIDVYYRLFDEQVGEAMNYLMIQIKEKGLSEEVAFYSCTQMLTSIAKTYLQIFVNVSNMSAIHSITDKVNQEALIDLFELYLLYGFCDTYNGVLFRLNILESLAFSEYRDKLFSLLSTVRKNAVALVDSFDYMDPQLCGSTLGAYDGNAYERLLEFARNSKFNATDVHEIYAKQLKPFMEHFRQKMSKL